LLWFSRALLPPGRLTKDYLFLFDPFLASLEELPLVSVDELLKPLFFVPVSKGVYCLELDLF